MARRYRLRGPEPVQRKLLAGLTAAGVTGASILEIGCGTGELQRRVLAAGAASAVGIDISGGMIEQARVTGERTGTAPRTTYLVGDAVERAEELSPAAVVLLDKVLCCYPEIDTLLARSVDGLSGGERQRVALARALMTEPDLLLLDEPLAALDTGLRDRILPYLERVRDEIGTPIVYVSHVADEVRRVADWAIVLEAGRAVRSGPPSKVLGNAGSQ